MTTPSGYPAVFGNAAQQYPAPVVADVVYTRGQAST